MSSTYRSKTCIVLHRTGDFGSHVDEEGKVKNLGPVYVPIAVIGPIHSVSYTPEHYDGDVWEKEESVQTSEVEWGCLGSSGFLHVVETAEEIVKMLDEKEA